MRDLLVVVLVFAVLDIYARRFFHWLDERRATAAMWASYGVGLLAYECEFDTTADAE